MTTYINRWTAVVAWLVLMLIVWALFMPRTLSTGTFTMLTLTGPLLILAGSALWTAQRPSPSIRQVRATQESDEKRTGA